MGERILELHRQTKAKENIANMVICFGYENLIDEFENIEIDDVQDWPSQESPEELLERLEDIENKLSQCADEELGSLLEEYDILRNQYNRSSSEDTFSNPQTISDEIRQAAECLVKLLKRGGIFGLHFLFCFDSAEDYLQLKMQSILFRHKIVFSLSEDSSYDILGSKVGSRIGEHVFLYNNGRFNTSCRPHLHKRLGLEGWKINEDGEIIQEV